MGTFLITILPWLLVVVVYLIPVIYVISLLKRITVALEKIAEK